MISDIEDTFEASWFLKFWNIGIFDNERTLDRYWIWKNS